MLAPVLVTAPAETPVSLAEAKEHLRIAFDDRDAEILRLIAAATADYDGWSGVLGRCLVTQNWRLDLRAFPCDGIIRLPLAPAQSVAQVKYRDADDVEQTLSASIYAGPLADALGPYIKLKPGQSWPATHARDDAVSVTFIAGYGAAAAVPADIKQAMLLAIERRFAALSPDQMRASVAAEDRLLAKYRRIGI